MPSTPEFTAADLKALNELTYALRGPSTLANSLNKKYALGLSDEAVLALATMHRRVFGDEDS